MSATNDGGPAFPVVHAIIPQPGHYTSTPPAMPGMTLRDWFAGMALSAVAAHTVMFEESGVANQCYKMAGAMLAARGKESEP